MSIDPYSLGHDEVRWKLQYHFALDAAIRDPRSLAIAPSVNLPSGASSPPPPPREPVAYLGDVPVYEYDARWTPGVILLLAADDGRVFAPSHTRFGERFGAAGLLRSTPLWTRHSLGVREAARDRRLRLRRGRRRMIV